MTESLVSLRLPAVIWLSSTALIVLQSTSQRSFGPAALVAWLVFLGGVAYFFGQLWRWTG